MAIDKKLQIFDDEGNPVDYDILASDVKFNDGKDLPTKLDEMEDEIGEGGYTPPDGGIPKTDLAPAVQTSLGLADTALQAADKAQLQSAINAVQTALDNLMNGQSVTDAIDTFNEVVTFLNGIGTDDPTLANQLLALNNAITALQNTLSSKANSSDLANYATKNELTSGLSGKQNTLTFDTTPTAGHTTQVMSSDSIKTAIDLVTPTIDENGKWVIGGVSTNHDAHGPMGNITIEDAEDMVALIVNDLTTGGQANFLSAEMGKALLSVILQIFGNLGEYAFPSGKPTLNFNTQISFPISYSTSDQHVTYADGQGNTAPTTAELLGRLEIQLGTNNDLYVINESAVKVFVGGTEVSGAYDPTTDKIVIPEVYGNVVIIAEAWTYVQDGLVLHLDGKNRGDVAGHWKSLVNYNNGQGFNDKIDFTLTNCDETHSDYVAFDGDPNGNETGSKAIANISLLDIPYDQGVIEVAYNGAELNNENLCIMHNNLGNGNRICFASWHPTDGSATTDQNSVMMATSPSTTGLYSSVIISKSDLVAGGFFSFKKNSFLRNGSTSALGLVAHLTQSTANVSMLSLMWRKTSSNERYYKGNLYSIRVYGTKQDGTLLTDADRARNLAIDRKRFNLS